MASELLKKKRELLKLTRKAIEEKCKSKRLSTSGRKIDMIERILNNPYVPPLVHDTSIKALQLLICGFIGKSNSGNTGNTDIINLCIKYYNRPLYVIILNNEQLKLSLLDSATKDCALTSNNVNIINKNKCKDFGDKGDVSICDKRNIQIRNFMSKYNSYNAIFKAGAASFTTNQYYNDCGLILYSNDIQPNNFDLFYYKLPDLPMRLWRKNDLIYSNKYGLIYIASEVSDSQAHFGNIYHLSINEKMENISWKTEQLPKPLRLHYHFPGNYCLINKDETEIFIVNGATNNSNYIKQTSIYNLETKEYKILANNPQPNAFGGITYNYNTNKIYIGGGEGKTYVYCYDFHKNKYITDNAFTRKYKSYRNPKLYLNESGTMLHIANFGGGHYVRHEWYDFRANENVWPQKWERNLNVREFKLWTDKQEDYISFIGFE